MHQDRKGRLFVSAEKKERPEEKALLAELRRCSSTKGGFQKQKGPVGLYEKKGGM